GEGVTAVFTENTLTNTTVAAADDVSGVSIQLTDVQGQVIPDPDGGTFMQPWLAAAGESLSEVTVRGSLADDDNDVFSLEARAGNDVDTLAVDTAVTTLLVADGGSLS